MFPKSQCICFSSKYTHDNNYILLEVDNELLEDINKEDTIQFKGEDHENVVLTTGNRTYDVVSAETSNSLLLVTDLSFKKDLSCDCQRHLSEVSVHKIAKEYLEVLPGRPHLKKAHQLLESSVYKGPELEYQVETKLYKYEELLANVQSSDGQLKDYLKALLTVTIDGYIRLLDVEYQFRVLSFMLKLIEENSWSLNEIDYDTTISSLSDIIPEIILDCVFQYYTEESKIIDFVQLYKYDEEKICKFFAQILLSNAGKFNLNEFLQAWSESVPEGMITKEEMLNGLAIIDRNTKPNVIWYLSENDLPEDINDRLKILFEKKKMWTSEEIRPYLEYAKQIMFKHI